MPRKKVVAGQTPAPRNHHARAFSSVVLLYLTNYQITGISLRSFMEGCVLLSLHVPTVYKNQQYPQKSLRTHSILHVPHVREYRHDQTILKVYGFGENKKIKVVTMNVLRTEGIEKNTVSTPRCQVNHEKLSENIYRAKSRIFEYSFCNPWDFFFTGTLDPNKQDRTDLELWHKQLTQWFRDLGKKYGMKIAFLLVPELHKDGATWHIHGLLHGISLSLLQQFKTGDKMGTSLAKKVQQGDVVYNWPEYQKRFGFCDLEPVKNHEAVSKYMTKYITKSLSSSVKELNAHLYYHSRGLKTAEVIKKGSMFADIEPSYRNEYCSMTWLPFSEELLQKLCNSFSFDWESPEYFTSEFEMWQREIENDGAAGVRGLSCGAADQRQFPKNIDLLPERHESLSRLSESESRTFGADSFPTAEVCPLSAIREFEHSDSAKLCSGTPGISDMVLFRRSSFGEPFGEVSSPQGQTESD